MKRQIIYPGSIPLETDLLGTNKNTMIALGKLIAAVFGTATFASGLACAPTAPASLSVSIGAGEIYLMQNVDGTAYSSIAADTTHQIMKQGIQLDALQLACAAPATAGNSINYLVQATFSEVDGNAVVLPYYNASNPSQAYSGPANAGTTNNTTRDGTVVLSAKAGVSAATGSQVTPTPDAGYVGLWVVTVANGQATIVAGNIAQYAGAPFAGTAALLNVANTFTQPQSGPTPAQFDATNKLATMAAVQQAGLHFQAANGVTVSANTTLTPTQANHWFNVSGSPVVTLPLLASVPRGSTYSFNATSPFTLKGGVSENIVMGSATFGSGGISVAVGQTITVVANDVVSWYVIARGFGPESFAASLSNSNGAYQKLPTGGLKQFGRIPVVSGQVVTFPTSFPSILLSLVVSGEGSGSISVLAGSPGLGGFTVNHNYAGTLNISYQAEGA